MPWARLHLYRQFLSESFLFSLIALLAALVLTQWFLPVFNSLSGKNLAFQSTGGLWVIGVMTGMAVIVGFVSGTIPAAFMANVLPIQALKEFRRPGSRASLLRKSLVVAQFALSIAFMIIPLFIGRQVRFMKTKDPGSPSPPPSSSSPASQPW